MRIKEEGREKKRPANANREKMGEGVKKMQVGGNREGEAERGKKEGVEVWGGFSNRKGEKLKFQHRKGVIGGASKTRKKRNQGGKRRGRLVTRGGGGARKKYPMKRNRPEKIGLGGKGGKRKNHEEKRDVHRGSQQGLDKKRDPHKKRQRTRYRKVSGKWEFQRGWGGNVGGTGKRVGEKMNGAANSQKGGEGGRGNWERGRVFCLRKKCHSPKKKKQPTRLGYQEKSGKRFSLKTKEKSFGEGGGRRRKKKRRYEKKGRDGGPWRSSLKAGKGQAEKREKNKKGKMG